MADEEQQQAPKKKERHYREVGEPSNKGVLITFGIIIAIAAIAFGYFMIFHFNDTFYEKQVVRVEAAQ